MLQQIIDRRLAGKNKSIGNRERFLRRYKDQIRDAVKRAVDGRGIRDLERGEEVRIPKKDISEPVFHHGQGGKRDMVHPGNKDYITGDKIQRPKGGGGQGSGKGPATDSGEGEDDFTFALSKEEFLQVFFEDLALPHLIKTQLADVPEWKSHRAGYSSDGTPSNLHIVRSMRGALSRRIALGGDARRELHRLEARVTEIRRHHSTDPVALKELAEAEKRISELRGRLARIPFLDPIDLRFRNRVRVPVPSSKAVMFCLMDVSASMDERKKDLAKRFFTLLYLFLSRKYQRVDVIFIRHTEEAEEVDEEHFFHDAKTGGTVVFSALDLMNTIITDRYPPAEWNLYGAQASDGDAFGADPDKSSDFLAEHILPGLRHFAYVEVPDSDSRPSRLAAAYRRIDCEHFAMRQVRERRDIYPVFRELFSKEKT